MKLKWLGIVVMFLALMRNSGEPIEWFAVGFIWATAVAMVLVATVLIPDWRSLRTCHRRKQAGSSTNLLPVNIFTIIHCTKEYSQRFLEPLH